MESKQLQFVKSEGVDIWIAEVTVNGTFNMHLERKSSGMLHVFQRTTQEGYFAEVIIPYEVKAAGSIVDTDFDGLVFPKTIRINSYSEVITGTITEVEQ